MNLFLRLLLVAIKARFRRAIGLLDECVSDFSVWWGDQDMFQHMTNSRYFSLTDVCIVDYMMRTRAWRVLRKRRWAPVVTYEDMVFRRMMRAPHRFVVRTQLVGWTDEHVALRHVFERRGAVTAEGITIARFVDRRGEVIAPGVVAGEVGHEGPSPALPQYAREAIARAGRGYRMQAAA